MASDKVIEKLRYFVTEAEKASDERKGLQRRYIIDSDPCAPLCINCRWCQQSGFLFHCPLFELPEDGKVVGNDGDVYYRRKGHKPKTYSNVPMKREDCEIFEPLIL